MAKGTDRLTQKQVEKFRGPGWLHDGRGLYLHVGKHKAKGGAVASGKNCLLRYQIDGKARWMGLGSYPEIGLARAREKALEARRLKAEGIDPLADRDARRAAARAEAAVAVTSKTCAEKYDAAHEPSWRNPKSSAQWNASLRDYAFPTIGGMPVSAIETGHVTKI